MTELEILTAAREKISSYERWTRRAPGRDQNGKEVGINETGWSRCVAWDAYGAVYSVAPHGAAANVDAVRRIRRIASKRIRRFAVDALVAFNDAAGTTHADVLSLYDEAIAECRLKEVA